MFVCVSVPECVYVPNVSAGACRGLKRTSFDPLEIDLCLFLAAMWMLRPEYERERI